MAPQKQKSMKSLYKEALKTRVRALSPDCESQRQTSTRKERTNYRIKPYSPTN